MSCIVLHSLTKKLKLDLYGQSIAICIPSIAPMICGMSQNSSKSLAMCFQSSMDEGGAIYIGDKTLYIAAHTCKDCTYSCASNTKVVA